MFNLFKKKKKYKEKEICVPIYKRPTLSFDSTGDKYLKIEDYIQERHKLSYGSLVKIKDNGISGVIELKKEFEGKTVLAKYGYAVLNNNGGIFFCSDVNQCIGKYLQNQYTSPSFINGPYSYGPQNISEFSRGPEFKLREFNNFISILSDIEYPIILQFLLKGCLPIVYNDGDNIVSANGKIYGYVVDDVMKYHPQYGYWYHEDPLQPPDQKRIFDSRNRNLPDILYGAFYIDTDPITNGRVLYHISESLLSFSKFKIKVADIKRPMSSRKMNAAGIEGYLFYNDDIKHYNSFGEYVSENKYLRRDRKLNKLLGEC